MEIIIVAGAPFSGKGTQCNVLKDILNCVHVSTGDRCRFERINGSKTGKIMTAYQDQGELIRDNLMKNLMIKILDENKSQANILLDGYPRSKKQVNDLLEIVDKRNIKIKKVINIILSNEELLERARKRAKTSKRLDDQNVEIHLKRIDIFENITKPSIEYMKNTFEVKSIYGDGSINEVTTKILSMI